MKLKLEHVNKTIKKALVLDDVTITLEGGRIYGLKGPNGSGKTMCDVNLPPDQNTLNETMMFSSIKGRRRRDPLPLSCAVSYIFNAPEIFSMASPAALAAFPAIFCILLFFLGLSAMPMTPPANILRPATGIIILIFIAQFLLCFGSNLVCPVQRIFLCQFFLNWKFFISPIPAKPGSGHCHRCPRGSRPLAPSQPGAGTPQNSRSAIPHCWPGH